VGTGVPNVLANPTLELRNSDGVNNGTGVALVEVYDLGSR